MNRFVLLGLVLSLSCLAEPIAAQTPQINPGGAVNGASFAAGGALAPGVIFSLFGTDLTDGNTAAAPSTPLPTQLAGARVLINGVAAPLFFSSPLQINAQFPVELAGLSSAMMQVEVQTGTGTLTSTAITVTVEPTSPGIFTLDQNGSGPGAILRNSDFSKICPEGRADCPANRAIRGEAIAIFMTGLGQVMGDWSSGQAATEASPTIATPVVAFDGTEVPVLFSGLAVGFVGLYQVNVLVPENTSLGASRSLQVSLEGVTHFVNIAIGSGNPPGTALPETTITAIAIDPSNPSTLFAGTADAGIFRTTDGGRSWTAAILPLANQLIRALAIDPANPATLYAATNNGVVKSTDGGMNWTRTSEVPLPFSLAIDPSNPATLYVGTNQGVFKSGDGAASWTASNSGITNPFILSLAIDPGNPATLYAGTNIGVFKSIDGGTSWTAVNEGLPNPRVNDLAVDPASPSTLYAATDNGVFKSTDGGASWTGSGSGIVGTAVRLTIDPANPATLYAETNGAGVFKSTDGGANWTAADNGLPTVSGGSLAINPSNPSTLYIGTPDGRVFRSVDGAATWEPAETD